MHFIRNSKVPVALTCSTRLASVLVSSAGIAVELLGMLLDAFLGTPDTPQAPAVRQKAFHAM
jgi:hypothetical protein